jgi:polyisoprenoid-binding protein YceI
VHSFVSFRARHLVIGRVDGRSTSFRGTFEVIEDAERLFDSIDASFDAASVNTHVQARDNDRSPSACSSWSI